MKRTDILIAVSVVLVIAILGFTFMGCSCWRKPVEGFTSPPATKAPTLAEAVSKPLTPQEKELFEDLKNNRLSEEDIKTLVQNNILNEQLVEKFLDKLVPAEEFEGDGEENVVEGFASVGNTYSCAAFGAE